MRISYHMQVSEISTDAVSKVTKAVNKVDNKVDKVEGNGFTNRK